MRLVAQISDNQSKMKHNFNLLEFFSLIIFGKLHSISCHRALANINIILVPLATSLRMVDFNVPDFASYGRRVVLKVGHGDSIASKDTMHYSNVEPIHFY